MDQLIVKKASSALVGNRSEYQSRFFQRKETSFKSVCSTAKYHGKKEKKRKGKKGKIT